MHPNAPLFFEKAPLALPLYAAFEAALLARFPDTEIRVQKTQISFSQRHGFACVSLPRRASERNAGALLVSEAGGVFCSLGHDAPYFEDACGIVASNRRCAEEALRIVQEAAKC